MGRSQRKQEQAGVGEAWMHLCRVESKLSQLRELASPDRFQNFVWELNDLISSVRKTINYLKNEYPKSNKKFRVWWEMEFEKFGTTPRNKVFLDLRNISEKDCAIVPREKHSTVPVGTVVEWTGPNVGLLKNLETGETIVGVLSADRSVAEKDLTVTKCRVGYYFEVWPDEEILIFLTHVVADIKAWVERAYDTFPNGFTFHKGGIASTGISPGL